MVLALVPGKFKILVLPLGYDSYLEGVPKYYIVVPNY
jgi:hypothetical protein